MEDAPRTSHFDYQFIASYTSDGRSDETFWFNNWMMTYFLVRPGTDPAVLNDKINASLIENIRSQLKQMMGISPEEFQEGGGEYGMYVQPLLDIHLDQGIDLIAIHELGPDALGLHRLDLDVGQPPVPAGVEALRVVERPAGEQHLHAGINGERV